MGYGLDASNAKFEMVTVLDQPMLFTCCRVDRDTIPESMHVYEVRHDDDMRGDPVEISDWIRVNHWGTLLTSKPIRLDRHPKTFRTYREIDPEEDWNYEGYEMTVKDYLEEYPPKQKKTRERDDTR